MILIHLRRAFKRIVFERIQNKFEQKKTQSQKLLFPKILEFNKQDITLLSNLKNNLKDLGFTFTIVDPESISINNIPVECQEKDLQVILEDLIEQHKNKENLNIKNNEMLTIFLVNSLSIINKKILSQEEMIRLKEDLLKCSMPSICPQGKRIMINLKEVDLEKYF